ncbi:hypothetical protein [Streptomyces sp. SID3212]|nr:hypothetical protein [Streptomyces sp. SID3212]MYV53874.1 hypothetical protein [Streptomyces sp. SID3212]
MPSQWASGRKSNDPTHLGKLVDALAADIDERTIHEYCALLRERSRGQPA